MGNTKLDAINYMLLQSGELPVNSLVDDGTNDTDLAERVLDDSIRKILSHGLGFNTETKEFAKDSNNKIALSSNILHFRPANQSRYRRLVKRGNFLYDLDNNTFEFDDNTVYLQVTYTWPFDEIPIDAQYWIMAKAARDYQMQTQRSRDMDQKLQEEEMLAKARALASDMRNRNSNYNLNFNGNSGNMSYRFGQFGIRQRYI